MIIRDVLIRVLIQGNRGMFMGVFLKNDSTPLYLQVKNKVKKDIRTGILKPGDKLPSETQMQKEYSMSRVTIRNAMAELETEGYIIKVQGKGSFVAQSDMLRLPIGVTSFSEDARIQGVEISSKVLKACVEDRPSEIDREFFKIPGEGEIMVVKRLRSVNGVPMVIEENHLSVDYRGLVSEDLSKSLYEILQTKYKVVPSNKGRRSVRITFATPEIADYLELSPGTPVIESEMCVFDMNGEPVHTVKDIVRGDNDRFFKWYV